MKKVALLFISVLLLSGCVGYSRYTIDQRPLIKIDTDLLGKWKAIEDSDLANFIFIQRYNDLREKNLQLDSACLYYISYVNRHGTNALYHRFPAFLSTVGDIRLLNMPYRGEPTFYHHPPEVNRRGDEGYFFVRLIKVAPDTVVTSVIADTTLKSLKIGSSQK